MKKSLLIALFLVALGGVLIDQRVNIMFLTMFSGEPPPLLEMQNEGPSVVWFDDYYTVQSIDERTFAIGETRYFQQNFNYLIAGEDRAILFDAGTGARDIREVANSLTSVPLTFVPSHLHYDHVGNGVDFERVALVDLPHLKNRAVNDQLSLQRFEHLGEGEGYQTPTLSIHEWLTVNTKFELGGRGLWVLYTPGHTEDSISLYDAESGYLFSGDFLYPGELYGFLPNSNLGDYLQGVRTVRQLAERKDLRIFGAHRGGEMILESATEPVTEKSIALRTLPELGLTTLYRFQHSLEAIKAGVEKSSGVYPVIYSIDDRVVLLADPSWLQRWDPIYPELEVSDNKESSF